MIFSTNPITLMTKQPVVPNQLPAELRSEGYSTHFYKLLRGWYENPVLQSVSLYAPGDFEIQYIVVCSCL